MHFSRCLTSLEMKAPDLRVLRVKKVSSKPALKTVPHTLISPTKHRTQILIRVIREIREPFFIRPNLYPLSCPFVVTSLFLHSRLKKSYN